MTESLFMNTLQCLCILISGHAAVLNENVQFQIELSLHVSYIDSIVKI